MVRLNFNSLKTRLILLGLAFIIMGGIARAFLLGNFLRKGVTESASSQLLTMADYVAKSIDQNIVERREMLVRTAAKSPLALCITGNGCRNGWRCATPPIRYFHKV